MAALPVLNRLAGRKMAKRSPRTAGDQQRRVSLTIKILPDLRDRLEALAEEDGRTLGNEIEKRLLKSLSLNDEILSLFDNPRTSHALSAIAASWKAVEILLERQWYDDRETLAAAQTSAHAIIGMIKPHSELDTTAQEESPAAQRMIAAEALGRKLAEHTRRRFKKLPVEDDPELDDALMALGIGSEEDGQDQT